MASNTEKTWQFYPHAGAQEHADRKAKRDKIRNKCIGAFIGAVIGFVIVMLFAAIVSSDREIREQNQRERQQQHDNGIADCKAQHGTIQLDRLGWYIGCLVPTPQG